MQVGVSRAETVTTLKSSTRCAEANTAEEETMRSKVYAVGILALGIALRVCGDPMPEFTKSVTFADPASGLSMGKLRGKLAAEKAAAIAAGD